MNNLIGDLSKKRMLALVVDNAFTFVLSIIVASTVNSLGNFAVVAALCLTYLMYFFVFEAFFRTDDAASLDSLASRLTFVMTRQ